MRALIRRLEESKELERPWTITPSRYLFLLGVHEPWIAEISPMQYAHMGKQQKAAYDAKRSKEWAESGKAKDQWRNLVLKAFADGRFTLEDPETTREARDVVTHGQIAAKMAAQKADADKRNAELERGNAITSADQVKAGDRVFVVLSASYGDVIKVSKKSVLVSGRFGPMKVTLSDRAPTLQWKSYDDLHGRG